MNNFLSTTFTGNGSFLSKDWKTGEQVVTTLFFEIGMERVIHK